MSVIVDDGSTDTDPIGLEGSGRGLSRAEGSGAGSSAGQSSATIAGIRAARGNWIATLDADLQNDPADLVRLWNALPGYDAALGWRLDRQDVWSRRVISRWANRVRNMVLGQSIRDEAARFGSSPARWRCVCPCSTGSIDSSGRSCCVRGAGWCRCRFMIDPVPWAVALRPLEPLAPGDPRPVRGRLADASAGAMPGGPDMGFRVGDRRVHVGRRGPARNAGGLSRVEPGVLAYGRLPGSSPFHRGSWYNG